MIALRIQVPGVRRQFFDMNPEVVKHVKQVVLQVRLPVLILNLTNDLLRHRRPERIQLQELIPAFFKEQAYFPAGARRFVQKA